MNRKNCVCLMSVN